MRSEAVLLRAERQRAQEKTELADVALKVFGERGYHATRIADISGAMGIGQGTFYKHFEGKRDVIAYLMERQIARVLALLEDENAASSATTADEYVAQVWRICTGLFKIAEQDAPTLRLLLLEAPSVDAEMLAQIESLTELVRALVRGYHENGMERGYFRSDLDLEAHTDAALGLVLGGLLRAIRDPADSAAHERYIHASLEMVLASALAGRQLPAVIPPRPITGQS